MKWEGSRGGGENNNKATQSGSTKVPMSFPMLKEHRWAWALVSGNVMQSAVADYASKEMHGIDLEKAEVVDCHPQYHQRCTLEA